MLILTPKAILNSNDLTANNELHVNGYRFYSYHQTLLFEPYQPRKHIPWTAMGQLGLALLLWAQTRTTPTLLSLGSKNTTSTHLMQCAALMLCTILTLRAS